MSPYNNLKRVSYNTSNMTEQELTRYVSQFKNYNPRQLNGGLFEMVLGQYSDSETSLFGVLDVSPNQLQAFMTMLGMDGGAHPTTNVDTLAFEELIQEMESGELKGIGAIIEQDKDNIFFLINRRFVELQLKHYSSQNIDSIEELKRSRLECNDLEENEKPTCLFEINSTLNTIKAVAKIYNKLISIMGGTVNNTLFNAMKDIDSRKTPSTSDVILPKGDDDVTPKILKYKKDVTTRNYIIIALICLLLFIFLNDKKK